MNATAAETSTEIPGRLRRWSFGDWFFPLVLAAVTFAVFWPVRSHEFINYDDPYYITANPHVQKGITKEGVAWAFGRLTGRGTYWHPVTWMSHMLDCQLFGLNAGAHHLVSLGIHAFNAMLLFFLLKGTTGAFWRSAIVATLFALHPLQTESVAWAAERKNVLSTFLGLLSIGFYVRYAQQKAGGKVGERKSGEKPTRPLSHFPTFYALALLFFALSLMSKPMLVTLPFALLLLDFWPLRRMSSDGLRFTFHVSRLILEKVPFFILSAVSCFITIAAHKRLDLVVSAHEISWLGRLANSAVAYGLYISKTIWPAGLSVYYHLPSTWTSLQIWLSLLLLVLLTFVAVRNARRHPWLPFGWLWFLGTLVPVIGIMQVGSQAMADRFIYVPIIGLFVALVWSCGEAANASLRLKRLFSSVAAAALLACVVGTAIQLTHWKNSVTLFRHALSVTTNNHLAHINLAATLRDMNLDDEASFHFQTALKVGPDVPEARFGLATLLERKQMFAAAAEQYAAILALNPTNTFALNNLAAVEEKLGKSDDALAHYSAAVRADPKYPLARYNLSGLLLRAGKRDEAIEHLQEVVRLTPDDASARNNLGVALAGKGDFENAIVHFREASRLRPTDADVHSNLSHILTKLGKTEEAKSHQDAAVRIRLNLLETNK